MNWPGWSEDPEIRTAFDWLISFLSPEEWASRKSKIEAYLEAQTNPRTTPISLTSPDSRVSFTEDQFGWYMYLTEAYLTHPYDYDFAQGARVIPIIKTFGRHFTLLRNIVGIDDRVTRMAYGERSQADQIIFEMAVALTYARNGWSHVEFIREDPCAKTPDIRVANSIVEWFIECKKLSKSSLYSVNERSNWLTIWSFLKDQLIALDIDILLDISFHTEIKNLEVDFLSKELIPKLRLAVSSGTLIDNAIWTVSVKFLDLDDINKHFREQYTKMTSSSFVKLITGDYESYKGFTFVCKARRSDFHPTYIDEIKFITGAIWNCDAEEAVQAKARDIRRHLAKATEQLPLGKPGIIHIGIESHDGWVVEDERFNRLFGTIITWDSKGKDLKWVFCHIFDPQVPPDENWNFGETPLIFSNDKPSNKPLDSPGIVNIDSTTTEHGAFWR